LVCGAYRVAPLCYAREVILYVVLIELLSFDMARVVIWYAVHIELRPFDM